MSRCNSEHKALGVYRIIDLTDEQGNYCTKLLADLGADVIKIEPPEGDKTRSRPPFVHDEVGAERSLYFLHFNTNKRSITLNLHRPEGQSIFKELVKHADAVIESLSVGCLQGLGLGYDVLKMINPTIVLTSISPFGQTGPRRAYKSSDIVNMAMGHMMQLCGEPDGPPLRLGAEVSYHVASQYAAVGTVLALYHSSCSGVGQRIDISTQECLYAYTEELAAAQAWTLRHFEVARSGFKPKNAFPWGGFECRDGWALIGVADASTWDVLANWVSEVTGDGEILDPMYKGSLFGRYLYVDILDKIVTDFTKRFTKNELVMEGQRRGIPIMPVAAIEEVVSSPQLAQRNYLVEAGHSFAGRLKYPGGPYRLYETPWRIDRSAPLLGEHNGEIYGSELGLSPQQLVELRSIGVI